MHYQAPVDDIRLALRVAGFDRLVEDGLLPEVDEGLADAILEEAGKFATDRIAPLNWIGDQHGAVLEDGHVTMPPGWKETYRDWAGAGWNGLMADPEFGGQGLPQMLQSACGEMWTAASMAFALGPLLGRTLTSVLPFDTIPSAAFVYAMIYSYETVTVTVPTLAVPTK